jgi:hypothetical protein
VERSGKKATFNKRTAKQGQVACSEIVTKRQKVEIISHDILCSAQQALLLKEAYEIGSQDKRAFAAAMEENTINCLAKVSLLTEQPVDTI